MHGFSLVRKHRSVFGCPPLGRDIDRKSKIAARSRRRRPAAFPIAGFRFVSVSLAQAMLFFTGMIVTP
jgi:hypothetical protein